MFFYHQNIFNKSIETGFFRVHIMLYRGKIKTRITFEGSDMQSNPFRVFTRCVPKNTKPGGSLCSQEHKPHSGFVFLGTQKPQWSATKKDGLEYLDTSKRLKPI